MNSRYYAGKQIMCEFVAITRWKVAICGEYMKSGLKTCSHGTACNFIHCFRNPGGDYEWADWDNPPPKYWTRKMCALFGHPAYDKQMELEDHEKSREDSNRKKTPTNNSRYHSRRSIDRETDARDRASIREDPDIKRYQYSRHSIRREHSYKRRKENPFLDKHEQSEENKSEGRYCSPSHDSGKDISKTRDGDFLERHWKYEEKNNVDDRYVSKQQTTEEFSRKERGRAYSIEQSKPEKHHKSKSHEVHKKEHESSDWHSGNENNNRVPSVRPSSEKTGSILKIDEERYDGGYFSECSDDFGSNRDSMDRTKKDHCLRGKREYDRYNSQHHKSHKSYNCEIVGENSKLRKQTGSQRDSFNDSSDDWRSTGTNSDREDTDDHLPSNHSQLYRKHGESGRKRKHCPGRESFYDSADDRRSTGANSDHEDTDNHLPSNSSRSYRKHGRSGRKRKHRPGKDEFKDSVDDQRSTGANSDHEDLDDHLPSNSSRPYRKNGRSGRKRKHRPGKDEYRKYDGENSNSDSSELTKRVYKKHSTSCTPIQ